MLKSYFKNATESVSLSLRDSHFMCFDNSSHAEVLMFILVVLETSLYPLVACQHVLKFKKQFL